MMISFSISGFIGPVLGASLYDAVGYRTSFDILMFAAIFISAIYCIFLAGPRPFTDYKDQKNKREDLRKVYD